MSLRISFSARPHLASAVSRLAATFFRLQAGDGEWVARVHLAAHELAENIAKYSTTPEVTLELAVSQETRGRTLIIRTRNRTSPQRLADVERRLRELMLAEDPDALYDRWLRQSLSVEGVSGLGLARIRAESGLHLDYAVKGDELTIVASGLLDRPETQRPSLIP